jgi:hypothetical protein
MQLACIVFFMMKNPALTALPWCRSCLKCARQAGVLSSAMNNEELVGYVERLQRQIRFWRILVVLSLLVSLGVAVSRLSASAERIDAKAVVAQQFELVNSTGRIVARWAQGDPVDPNAAELLFKYPNDKQAAAVGVLGGEPFFTVFNTDGHSRATLTESSEGSEIDLFDEEGHVRIIAKVKRSGPEIMILNKSMTKKIWVAPPTTAKK